MEKLPSLTQISGLQLQFYAHLACDHGVCLDLSVLQLTLLFGPNPNNVDPSLPRLLSAFQVCYFFLVSLFNCIHKGLHFVTRGWIIIVGSSLMIAKKCMEIRIKLRSAMCLGTYGSEVVLKMYVVLTCSVSFLSYVLPMD